MRQHRTAPSYIVAGALLLTWETAAQAYPIKTLHGTFCRPDDTDGVPNYDRYGEGYAIHGDGSSAICPFFSTEGLELDTVQQVDMELTFTSISCANNSFIRACYVNDGDGSHTCNTTNYAIVSHLDCDGDAHVYSLSGYELLGWEENNSVYPYLYFTAGEGTHVYINGYNAFNE